MTALVYLNGQFLPRDRATLSVDERGFFFGDGIYEVTRAHDGRLFEFDRHMARLTRGLGEIRLTSGLTVSQWREIHDRLLRENDLLTGDAAIYLQVTRGAAPRTHYFPPAGTPPTVYANAFRVTPPHDLMRKGGAVITTPDIRWSRCDIKSVNLLPAVMAKQSAVETGAFEAIFVRADAITEGSHTNAFGVLHGEIRTYPMSPYILGGITRDVVLELAAELGIRVTLMPVTVREIPQLEEFFITGTTSDVMPITKIDGRPVADGQPGPITCRLRDALAARIAGTGR